MDKSKMNYSEFTKQMRAHNKNENPNIITGVIVISPDSFSQDYSLESRSYLVSSDNKAYMPNMCGYSIFGTSLDGSDKNTRLDAYLAKENGGKGWIVDYCYF